MFEVEVVLIENIASSVMINGNMGLLTRAIIVASEVQEVDTSYNNKKRALDDILMAIKSFKENWLHGEKDIARKELSGVLDAVQADIREWKEEQ